MISTMARGLTSKQAWTLAHVIRCETCGSWMVGTTLHGGKRPVTCSHLEPKSATKGHAA